MINLSGKGGDLNDWLALGKEEDSHYAVNLERSQIYSIKIAEYFNQFPHDRQQKSYTTLVFLLLV